MKKILRPFLLVAVLLPLSIVASAQCSLDLGNDVTICTGNSVVLGPPAGYFSDSIIIEYDATQGQTALMGAAAVYMHSGAQLHPLGGWQYTTGNWGANDGIGQMTNLGGDIWRIAIEPISYYNYSSDSTLNGIWMVFRNGDGSAEGKDTGGVDIFLDLSGTTPMSSFAGITASWKTDGIDSLVWSTGATTPTITVNKGGDYALTVTDTAGCMASDTVNVQSIAPFSVDLGNDTAFCTTDMLTPAVSLNFFEDTITITYDATLGQTGLVGDTNVYMHSANEEVPFGGPVNWIGNWGVNDGLGRMTNIGPNLWQIKIHAPSYYGFNQGDPFNGIFMVFRNFDGSLTGKDDTGMDIFMDVTTDPPTSAFAGVTGAKTTDELTVNWSTGAQSNAIEVNQSGTYWVTIADKLGCANTDTINISVGLDLGSDTTACTTNPMLALDAGVGFQSYTWSTGGNSQTEVVTTSGTYSVAVIGGGACMLNDTIEVQFHAPPEVDLGNDTAFCGAVSLQLTPWVNRAYYEDSLIITYDATQGQTGLVGDTNVYIHSANEEVPLGGPVNWIGNWGMNDGVGRMTNIGTDLWQITIYPPDYYGFAPDGDFNGIFMVFRNHDGSQTGKDDLGNDIWLDVVSDPPSSGFSGVTAAWKTDGLQPSWSDGSSFNTTTIDTSGAHWITLTDTNGCSVSDTINIASGVDLGADTIVCAPGTVTLDAGAGFTNYTWSTLETTQTITANSSGTYFVTALDGSACASSDTVEVTINAQPVVSLGSDTALCNGDTLTLDAGAGYASYAWSSSSNQTIKVTASGDYTVTVTDTNGCQDTDTIKVDFNPLPPADAGMDVTICVGNPTTLNASGGSQYAWTPSTGLSSTTIANPSANPASNTTYTVTVTDANGCAASDDVTVTVQTSLTADAGADETICEGGSHQLQATGGATYVWSPSTGLDDPNIANPTASPSDTTTYVVTVSSGTCSDTDTVSINVAPVPTADAGADTSICPGASVMLNGAGGGTYDWSPAGTLDDPSLANPVATPTSSTIYQLVVENTAGCTDTATVMVTVYNMPTITTISDTTICKWDSVGLNATAGFATYAWTPSTALSATNVANPMAYPQTDQTYTVVGTDANGCSATDMVAVMVADSIEFDLIALDPDCPQAATGGIDLTVTAGTGPFTYNWSNATTDEDPDALVAGTYTIAVMDVYGCDATDAITLNDPAAMTTNIVPTDASCTGTSDGSADLTVTNGNTPLSYAWSNTATSEDLSNVTSGMYYVTVTDASLCTVMDSVLINDGDSVITDIVGTNLLCNGDTDGSANLTVTGGASPYSFIWSNAATTEDIINLTAGTYSVVVQDQNNCQAIDSIAITEPAALVINLGSTMASCGSADGSAFVVAAGGTQGYNYQWNNGGTTDSLTGLMAGTYTVMVTDANGCDASDSVMVIEMGGPTIDATNVQISNATCDSINGSITGILVSGGAGPYSYDWDDGTTITNTPSADLTNVGGGSYTLTVTDQNNCTSMTGPYMINATSSPTLSVGSITHVKCYGDTDGAIDVSVGGGSAPYDFLWSNGATTEDISNVAAGNYTMTVTDDNGCQASVADSIGQPDSLAVTASSSAPGTAAATASGGMPPYTYAWDNGQTSQEASGLTAGQHEVTVTDANGCTSTAKVDVEDEKPGLVGEVLQDHQLTLFPNPTNGMLHVSLVTSSPMEWEVEVFNILGEQVIQPHNQTQQASNNLSLDLGHLPSGVYLVKVHTEKGTLSRKIKLLQ